MFMERTKRVQDWGELIADARNGSTRALARLITRVENRDPGWMDAMKAIHLGKAKARVIGITGPPGAGKSTLTDKIARGLLDQGHQVGIIAVDPTSPFSGGALLGDRLRMNDISAMDGVFVRSMATRGTLGGLNLATPDVAKIMAAAGKDFVLIETVGVGQDEIEVVKTADLVMVLCVPGQGDAIQAIKAGVMEIADIFVVNKADREGAEQVVADIQCMLDLTCEPETGRKPLICKTAAATGKGIPELISTILDRLETTVRNEAWKKKQVKNELMGLLEKEVARVLREQWDMKGVFEKTVDEIFSGQRDPYSVVQEIITPLSAAALPSPRQALV